MSRFCETSTDSHTPTKALTGYPSLTNSTSPTSVLASSSYPSPSPTYSDVGNKFHLPPSTHHCTSSLDDRTGYVGSIPDSPIIMRSDAYKSAVPPTLLSTIPPVPTPLAYESVYDGTSPQSPSSHSSPMEGDSFYYPFTGDFSDYSDSSDVPSPSFYPFTPSSQSSCSTLQSPLPLSPVSAESPEWSLFSSYGNSIPRDLDFDAPSPPFGDSEGRGIFQDRFSQTDSKSPKHASSLLSNQWLYYNNCPHPDDGYPLFCPESPKPLCQRLDPIDLEDTALPPLPFASHRCYGEDNEAAARRENNDYQGTSETRSQQRKAELISPPSSTIPRRFFPLMHRNSVPELEDNSMDTDFPNLFEGVPPPSPSGRSCAALPDDNDTFPSASPFTPSLDTDMDILDSPTLSLLSLPGADIDEDLLPPDPAVARPASAIKSSTYTNPLLVLDDDTSSQQDSQRSPSPEPCALLDITHLRPEMQNDEEMKKVFGLLKRAKEKERAAKQLEVVVEREERTARSIGSDAHGSGAVNAVMDARRRTKKWKNKVREIAILLRFNLAQRGLQVTQDECGGVTIEPSSSSSPSVGASRHAENAMEIEQIEENRTSSSNNPLSSKKPPIRSPQHLLVRMILDRHEPKYNANLRVGLPSSRKTASPLRRSLLTAGEMENKDILEHDGANDTCMSGYSDSISSFNSGYGSQNADLDSNCSADKHP